MKRISKITIQNFQSHKNTEIEPLPTVTVVVGHTDSGKSAFIRALNWCLYNVQPKSQLINKDADYAMVQIMFDDGTGVRRYKSRSGKENSYTLIYADGKEQTFQSVGNTPLKEVMDFHKMYEVDMFNRNISLNMAGQFDNLFFLSENPSDKGTLISQMAKTEVVDEAISICSARMVSSKKMLNAEKKNEREEQKRQSKLSYIHDLGDFISEAEDTRSVLIKEEQRVQGINSAMTEITDSLHKMEVLRKTIVHKAVIESYLQTVEKRMSEIAEIQPIIASYESLSESLEKICTLQEFRHSVNSEAIEKLCKDAEELIEKFSKMDSLRNAATEIDSLCNKLKKYKDMSSYKDSADDYLNNVTIIENKASSKNVFETQVQAIDTWYDTLYSANIKNIQTLKSQLAADEAEYKDKLKESGTCPVCGSKFDEEHINHAMEYTM